MTALTADELLHWVDHTTANWQQLCTAHPELLRLPCTIRESSTVLDLLHHIASVELRYAERLADLPETPIEAVPREPIDALFAVHTRARALLAPLTERDSGFWDASFEFSTRSAGLLPATRRVVFAHALLHSIRHYAQLATIAREHGIPPGWPMDFLFLFATPVAPPPAKL